MSFSPKVPVSRLRGRHLIALVAVSSCWGLLMWGCSAAGDGDDDGASSAGDDGGQGGAASGQGGSVGDGGSGGLMLGTGGSSPCPAKCSGDLHSILDCNGVVLKTCPPDQGCGADGMCVPACDAADANASTIGCEFYSVTPAMLPEARGGCFAVMVANSWSSEVTIGAEYNNITIDTTSYLYKPQSSGDTLIYTPSNGVLAAGELGILFLSKYESGDKDQVDCPVPQALEMNTQLDWTGRGRAFQITATRPIVAYDVYPWGGATSYVTSATLLVPTPTWGTNFITADAWGPLDTVAFPFTQVVAAQDNTTVTMVPVSTVVAGSGVMTMPANVANQFTLHRGEVIQFLQTERLAGSTLQSDKPISVWGGSSCMNIPDGTYACDGAHQQLLPVPMLGNQYAGVRYPSRGGDDSAPYTVVGAVNNTQLSYDPAPPSGAPTTLQRGQVAVFFTDQVFTVQSQDLDHPFYMAAHMTGGGTNSTGLGDPEYVNLVTPAQYLSDYLFVTDPTYSHTALVFVRQRGDDNVFHDVTLDCLGPITPWWSLGNSGDFEYAQIMIRDNGAGVGTCTDGVHTATSEQPFGLTVWGYAYYASYAYPAGMAAETINTVIVPPTPN